MRTALLSPSEVVDLLANDGDVGPLAGTPMVAVDLDAGDGTTAHRAATLAREAPLVTVGVAADGGRHPEPPVFDVLVTERGARAPWVETSDVDACLAQLGGAVSASPGAAVALVQLLRAAGALPAADALTAESWVFSMLQAGPDHARWLAHRAPSRQRRADGPRVVRLAREGASLEIVLDRPGVRNAYDTRMRDQLVEALQLALRDTTISDVVLRGEGASFCAGGDLAEFGTRPDVVTAHLVRSTRHPARLLAAVAGRTTVHVQGPVVGAGVELAAFAGTVIAAPDSTFRLPEISMGLIPGAGGTVSVPRRIGAPRFAWLALTGSTIDARRAIEWGLVDAVTATDQDTRGCLP